MNNARTLLAFALVSTLPTLAQVRPSAPVFARSAHGFEENKGQVTTLDGKPAPFVNFRLTDGGTNVFLLGNGIAYQFNRFQYPEGYKDAVDQALRDPRGTVPDRLRAQVRLEAYRMDMELDGADPHARVTASGRSADHTNYCNHPGEVAGQEALDVHGFTEVTYHEVYPGIDRVVRVSEAGIEQDFVVRPGADPSRIRMRFTDQEELRLDEAGGLVFGNRLGRFQEQRPVSRQGDRTIATRFVLEGNMLRFDLDAYDPERPLVIDPPLQWATYYGTTEDDQSQACTVDATGNIYLTGWSNSAGGIATAGSYQTVPGGLYDGAVMKLGADGVLQWATYYGGEADDAFRGAAADADGNVYSSGITSSVANIAYNMPNSAFSGGVDAMLLKLTGDGVPLWATYYGGEGEDRGRWCSVDGSGNVYMTGLTASGTNIATPGSYQQIWGAYQDGFLVKFNSDGVRQWGTYYGGGSDEQAMGCVTDADGNTYIAGGTGTSTGTAIASAGSYQPDFGAGGSDAFLAKFNSEGFRLWGTYYGGDAPEFGFACGLDAQGNVFTTGDTFSGNGTSIATAGAHQTTIGGGVDAFLVKFNSTGARQWGTYYGGLAGDFGRGCFADGHGTIYLIGETESSANISTPGAYQEVFGGAPVDVFMARFFIDGSRDFGTYYGGEAQDYASSGAIDNNGNTYLLGVTGSQNAISTPGAHQVTLGGGIDIFLAKFDAPLDCLGEPNGPALPATQCDDGDICTVNDVWSHECVCAGTLEDSDADGVCDSEDPCPALPFLTTGDPCDDGSELTNADEVNGDCACFGILVVDCLGVLEGTAQPGTPCDDNDACTTDDIWDLSCTCAGIFQDMDNDGLCDVEDSCPDVPGQVGDACDDNDVCTVNEVLDAACACVGTVEDTDGDGLCDAIDPCPDLANTTPGDSCDDLDLCTVNDMLSTDCVCAGTFLDTDGDTVCDPMDDCPLVPGQVGSVCDDEDDCTTGDILNAACMCTGTTPQIGAITGADWVVHETTNTYSIDPVPGATAYSWDPLPTGWITTDATQPQLVVTADDSGGNVTLCVTVYISSCTLDTCIDVHVSGVGIEEAGNAASPWYMVSPNPSSGNFLLTRTDGTAGRVTFTVLDATGRMIMAPSNPTGQRSTVLDLGDVSPGVYFLRVESGEETQVLPLMVQR